MYSLNPSFIKDLLAIGSSEPIFAYSLLFGLSFSIASTSLEPRPFQGVAIGRAIVTTAAIIVAALKKY